MAYMQPCNSCTNLCHRRAAKTLQPIQLPFSIQLLLVTLCTFPSLNYTVCCIFFFFLHCQKMLIGFLFCVFSRICSLATVCFLSFISMPLKKPKLYANQTNQTIWFLWDWLQSQWNCTADSWNVSQMWFVCLSPAVFRMRNRSNEMSQAKPHKNNRIFSIAALQHTHTTHQIVSHSQFYR